MGSVMQWLMTGNHWIVTWAALGLALDAAAQVTAPGKVQRLLQALAHVSPAAVFSAVKALQAGSPPPPAGPSVMGSLLVLWLLGCGGATAAYEAAYADEQLLCVDIATSRSEADACRDKVRQRWCAPGKPLDQAEACVYSVPADAGGGQ